MHTHLYPSTSRKEVSRTPINYKATRIGPVHTGTAQMKWISVGVRSRHKKRQDGIRDRNVGIACEGKVCVLCFVPMQVNLSLD
jgi:hypothetical protein